MRSKNESSGTRPTLGAGGDSPRRERALALLAVLLLVLRRVVLRRRRLLEVLAHRVDELVSEDEHPAAGSALGAETREVTAVGGALADDQRRIGVRARDVLQVDGDDHRL